MGEIVSYSEAVEFCKAINISIVSYSGYASKPSIFKCEIDGHQWSTNFSKIKCGARCVVCSYRKNAENFSTPLCEVEEFCNKYSIEVLSYGGNANKSSTFRCLKDGHIWSTRFTGIKGGSRCPKCSASYLYGDIIFDSGWELIFYLYQLKLGKKPIRISSGDKSYQLRYCHRGKSCSWYPDFVVDDTLYEIKATGAGVKHIRAIDYEEMNAAKKTAHPNVVWVTDQDIKQMEKEVGSIAKYRHSSKRRIDKDLITIAGRQNTFSNWCTEYGISYSCAMKRIKRGYDEVSAITIPLNHYKNPRKPPDNSRNRSTNVWITIDVESNILADWCTKYGVHRKTVSNRHKRGMSWKEALTIPVDIKKRNKKFSSDVSR